MNLIAQLKLVPTPEQADLLKRTLEQTNAACNAISAYAWDNQVFNQFALHKALYYDLRAQFSLSAQVTVRCLGKVADAYKTERNTRCTFQPQGAIAYDSRILSYRQETETVSIWVLG